jgi:hypothetical protein
MSLKLFCELVGNAQAEVSMQRRGEHLASEVGLGAVVDHIKQNIEVKVVGRA